LNLVNPLEKESQRRQQTQAIQRPGKPHQFLDAMIFWRPANLNLARRSASAA